MAKRAKVEKPVNVRQWAMKFGDGSIGSMSWWVGTGKNQRGPSGNMFPVIIADARYYKAVRKEATRGK